MGRSSLPISPFSSACPSDDVDERLVFARFVPAFADVFAGQIGRFGFLADHVDVFALHADQPARHGHFEAFAVECHDFPVRSGVCFAFELHADDLGGRFLDQAELAPQPFDLDFAGALPGGVAFFVAERLAAFVGHDDTGLEVRQHRCTALLARHAFNRGIAQPGLDVQDGFAAFALEFFAFADALA